MIILWINNNDNGKDDTIVRVSKLQTNDQEEEQQQQENEIASL